MQPTIGLKCQAKHSHIFQRYTPLHYTRVQSIHQTTTCILCMVKATTSSVRNLWTETFKYFFNFLDNSSDQSLKVNESCKCTTIKLALGRSWLGGPGYWGAAVYPCPGCLACSTLLHLCQRLLLGLLLQLSKWFIMERFNVAAKFILHAKKFSFHWYFHI